MPGEKQIPRATSALGMTKSAFFRSLFSRDIPWPYKTWALAPEVLPV
jgi:hypothetical protein